MLCPMPRFTRIFLIQILFILALLPVVEITLRVLGVAALWPEPNGNWNYQYDPEFGWSARPNSAGHITITRTVKSNHNSLGMRDIEVDPAASSTILFLGDSLTWGFDVEPEERFSDLLRPNLPSVQILNAGIVGYGTDQEYLQLLRLWPHVRPNIVILMFCVGNDRDDNSTNFRYLTFKPYLVNSGNSWEFRGQPVPVSPRQFAAENWFAHTFTTVRLVFDGYSRLVRREISAPDATEQLLLMMRGLVEARGAKFLVGLQRRDPVLEQFFRAQEISYVQFDGAETFPDWGGATGLRQVTSSWPSASSSFYPEKPACP
jgi:hypothetical protein